MNIILTLLCFYGITYFFKEAEITDWLRIRLIRLHPIFYKLFACFFCSGCWGGILTYIIVFKTFNVFELLVYMFASGAVCLIIDGVVQKIYSSDH